MMKRRAFLAGLGLVPVAAVATAAASAVEKTREPRWRIPVSMLRDEAEIVIYTDRSIKIGLPDGVRLRSATG